MWRNDANSRNLARSARESPRLSERRKGEELLGGDFGFVGEDADVVVEHFDEAAVQIEHLLRAAFGISQRALAEDTQQGGVAGQDAHITVFARQFGFRDLSVDEQVLRSGHFELERVCHLLQLLGGFQNVVNRALHVESAFRQRVVFAVDDFFEAADCVCQLHVFAGNAGELFGHVEGLR